MSDTDIFEFQAFNDWREARRRGFEVEETKPTRSRPGFGQYVVKPSLLFGILTAVMVGGVLTALAVLFSFITVTAVYSFPAIIIGSAVAFGAAIMSFSAVLLVEDWRQLQVETKKRVYLGEPQREPRGRIMTQVGPGHHVISKVEWDQRWQEKLARRVYNERGQWVGGSKVTRKQLAGLYVNETEKYGDAREYLRGIGWLSVGDEWTEKARTALLAKLRIV